MKIVFKDTFVDRLENQLDYIAEKSPENARKLKDELLIKIKEIPLFPFRYRKSIYFEDNNIRDLIFKGYTIVFRITEEQIEIFGLVKYQNSPHD